MTLHVEPTLPDCCYVCRCGRTVCMDEEPSPGEQERVCADCHPDAQGLRYDMAEDEYHAHEGSISHSGLKVLLNESPAEFRWQQDHPVQKPAFDLGSAAHKLVLGAGAPVAVCDRDDKRGNDWKAHEAQARNDGAIPLTRKEYAVVEAMAERLSSHTLAIKLLADCRPEVSAFAIDEETSILRRCRFDGLGPGYAVDYKSTVDERPRSWAGRYGIAAKNGYDTQAAFYSDVAADLGYQLDAFCFIVQRKTPPYPVAVLELTVDSLVRARERIRHGLAIYADCLRSGEWPDSQLPGTYHLIDTDDPSPFEVLL